MKPCFVLLLIVIGLGSSIGDEYDELDGDRDAVVEFGKNLGLAVKSAINEMSQGALERRASPDNAKKRLMYESFKETAGDEIGELATNTIFNRMYEKVELDRRKIDWRVGDKKPPFISKPTSTPKPKIGLS